MSATEAQRQDANSGRENTGNCKFKAYSAASARAAMRYFIRIASLLSLWILRSWSNSGKHTNRAIRPALRKTAGAAGQCTFFRMRRYVATQERMTNVIKPTRLLATMQDGQCHAMQAIERLKAGNIKPDTEVCNVA
jgi:hypothetical protein